MTLLRLLLLNLVYHRRGNLAVLLGVVVGAAVLTGALLVGDSLRGSLRDQSLRRLGWVEQTLVAPRFFRAALAREVSAAAEARVCPVLFLQATASGTDPDRSSLRGINVLGVDASFFGPGQAPPRLTSDEPLVWINRAVADSLGLSEGDTLLVRLQKPEAVPREAGLGKKESEFSTWKLNVAGVLADSEPGAVFNLRPEIQTPRNVLVSGPLLQEQLGVAGQVNVLLAAGEPRALEKALDTHVTLADWGLVLRTPTTRARALIARYDTNHDGRLSYAEWLSTRSKGRDLPRYAWVLEDSMKPANRRIRTEADLSDAFYHSSSYVSLESTQLLLTPQITDAALDAAAQIGARVAPTLVYLCRMKAGKTGALRAGVVAALDPTQAPPLGPFLPPGKKSLGDREIVLLDDDWQPPNRPAPGSPIYLRFKPPESHGPAEDVESEFTLAGFLSPEGPAVDPSLTPDFPGITDQDDTGAWKLPFDDEDWKRNISREYNDRYWKQYRGTPKAYINLATGQKLWGSRFGSLTSIRLAPGTGSDLDHLADDFAHALREKLKPASGGFVFEPARANALQSAEGNNDFGQLFLGFSFFLIAAALLLVGLLFRLNLDRRAEEVGLLFAEGYSHGRVRNLLLGEGGILSLVGSGLGLILALGYAALLVQLLALLWPGGTLRSFLRPHTGVLSLVIGGVSGVVISLLAIAWVVRGFGKLPARALLAGQTTGEGELGRPAGRPWRSRWVAGLALVGGLALLGVGTVVPGQEAQAGTFFGSGALFLTACLAGLSAWMQRSEHRPVEGHGWWNVGRLGVRNAARHPARSLLTVGLLASAAFVLVAVESFRRQADTSKEGLRAPDGGFRLLAESDLPIYRDLNSTAGRNEILAGLRARLQGLERKPDEIEKQIHEARGLLGEVTIYQLRVQGGDDASCLNLYQPRRPRLLGVPETLIQRGGFVFEGSQAATPLERNNPWLILSRPVESGQPIPALAEGTTVSYGLHKNLGDTIEVPDSTGNQATLLLAGLLHDSVFQSSLLISDKHFLELYPGHEGYNFFLLEVPAGKEEAVKRLLEQALADRGVEVTRSAARLESYLAVENTYLTTFQALGGLGLLLGSLGLAVVLLRAIWERRAELALLRALGFRRLVLGWLVLAENGALLLFGLAAGTLSALASVAPSLISGNATVPWLNLLLLFAGVIVVGLAAGTLAVVFTLRAPLVPALRKE
jgi:ABC-type antimicrobial peptide transport system permease subunit